jgi:hypothetical protein
MIFQKMVNDSRILVLLFFSSSFAEKPADIVSKPEIGISFN